MATDRNQLDAFVGWLESRASGAGTIASYLAEAEAAECSAEGWKRRVLDEKLAPKTRHRIRAAGRQWAAFIDDTQLDKDLKAIKLPVARRVTAKVPISHVQLISVVNELALADYLEPAMRATIGVLVCRGLRCGDMLRMLRSELVSAIETQVLAFEGKGKKRLEFPLVQPFSDHVAVLAAMPGSWNRVEDLIAPGSKSKKPGARRKSAAKAVERSLDAVASKCGIRGMYPHRLRRTYAVEYLLQLAGRPDAVELLRQHMQWEDVVTAMEYVNHARSGELSAASERIFKQ